MMCFLLSRLLNDCISQIHPELSSHLKSKLCRRIVKLKREKETVPLQRLEEYEKLLVGANPSLKQSVSFATEKIKVKWDATKKALQRPVLPLPQRWLNSYLHLRCSRGYLKQFLDSWQSQKLVRNNHIQSLPQAYRHAARFSKPTAIFANHYFLLSDKEVEIEYESIETIGELTAMQCKENCMGISEAINDYLDQVGSSYDSNSEQKSLMLLTVMELWMAMDSTAIKAFGILGAFNTGFAANILDVLQLARRKDMLRLKKIRAYIQLRDSNSKYPKLTMFSSVQKGCFAERFYDESPDSHALFALHKLIEEDAYRSREEKEEELQTKTMEFEEIARELMVATVSHCTPPLLKTTFLVHNREIALHARMNAY